MLSIACPLMLAEWKAGERQTVIGKLIGEAYLTGWFVVWLVTQGESGIIKEVLQALETAEEKSHARLEEDPVAS